MSNLILLLTDNDKVLPDDWCRPLYIQYDGEGYADSFSTTSCYSGSPQNNLKWVQVRYIFGKFWYGKTVKELLNPLSKGVNVIPDRMEFVRGDIPDTHKLNIS